MMSSLSCLRSGELRLRRLVCSGGGKWNSLDAAPPDMRSASLYQPAMRVRPAPFGATQRMS